MSEKSRNFAKNFAKVGTTFAAEIKKQPYDYSKNRQIAIRHTGL